MFQNYSQDTFLSQVETSISLRNRMKDCSHLQFESLWDSKVMGSGATEAAVGIGSPRGASTRGTLGFCKAATPRLHSGGTAVFQQPEELPDCLCPRSICGPYASIPFPPPQ